MLTAKMKSNAVTPHQRRKMEKSQGMQFGSRRAYMGREVTGKYIPVPKHNRQSTIKQIGLAAKRFAKDKDVRNAVELLKIAYPNAKLYVRKATDHNIVQ